MLFVIGLNSAIALIGFYLAWRIWQAKRALTAATVMLDAWERDVRLAIHPPNEGADIILEGRKKIAETRSKYARFREQVQQLQQIFWVTLWGLRLMQQARRFSR